MVITYANEKFYATVFRGGMVPPVSGPEFDFYARLATKEIRARTFGNIREEEIPYEVQMCCCELAEYMAENARKKDENGRILQSYSNDGDSGTFQAEDLSVERIKRKVDEIVRSWLLDTGLMYCGVRRR